MGRLSVADFSRAYAVTCSFSKRTDRLHDSAGSTKKRTAHLILGLKVANRFVYPKLQFDRYGQVLPGLAAILKHLFSSEQNSLEVVARFNDRRPFLEGRSIKDCLLAGQIDQAEMTAVGFSTLRT